jgi:hypothetical protein
MKKIKSLYITTKNPVVKLFFHSIMMDTSKHADMYQIILDLNERSLLGKINREKMIVELSNHISIENKMLKRTLKIIDLIKDENLKKIIQRIIEDEKKHHKILKELFEIIRKEGKDWNREFYEVMLDYP